MHLRDAEEEEVREGSAVPGVSFGHVAKAGGRLITKRGMHEMNYIDMPGDQMVICTAAKGACPCLRRRQRAPVFRSACGSEGADSSARC